MTWIETTSRQLINKVKCAFFFPFGIFKNLIEGGWKRLKKKKAGHVVGMPLDSFKTIYEKRLFKKLVQILNDPTHQTRHYLDSRHNNRSGRFFTP